jgi:hypothetical protein
MKTAKVWMIGDRMKGPEMKAARNRLSSAASLAAVLLSSGLLVGAAGCAATTVRVPIADGASETRETQKLDCGVYDERTKSLTVGLSFSALFGAAAAGPYVTSAETAGVKWEKAAQMVVAQYKEVCSRYNAGAISQPSYDSRISEIDALYAEAQGIRASADSVIRGHSKEAFADLDKNTSEGGDQIAQAQQVVVSIDVFYAKVGGQ